MPNFEDDEYDAILGEEKILVLTKNEALYLSDSITLLLEHTPESGRIHIPARHLMPSAGVPVPVDLIQKIGLAVLLVTDPKNTEGVAEVTLNIADLFLLRECCQSFVRINNELVGFNLLRKIYYLILENEIVERSFIEDLTAGIDMNILSRDETLSKKKRSTDG